MSAPTTAPAEVNPAAPRTFAEAQDILAASLPGYSRRTHQMALAAKVEEAIQSEMAALLQAGTGTGKSLALLIPFILSGKRSIVATSTKALQNQYSDKDLPFLAEHLGVPFTWAVLKGRSNYPCHEKAQEISNPSRQQKDVLARMEQLSTTDAIKNGEIIDREDFPALADEDWRAFSMSAGECPGARSCPFAVKCFAERAKAKAAAAQVVVTNTAYLMLDLQLKLATEGNVALLGDYDLLAVDEAHNLPDAATRALEDTVGEGTFRKLSRDMAGYLHDEGADDMIAVRIEHATEVLWSQLQLMYREFARKAPNPNDPMPLTVHTIISPSENGGLREYFQELYHAIKDAREQVKATTSETERGRTRRYRLMNRSQNWLDRLLAYTTDPAEMTLRWLEQDTKLFRGERQTKLFLRSAPISVAPFLRVAMWDKVPTLLSSATLAAGRDFSYLERTVGLEQGEALTYDAGSPFDYQRQVRMFVPDDKKPEPDKKTMVAWRGYAQATTLELVKRSGGGALLLFTSTTAMKEAHANLGGQFTRMGLTVLRQGEAPPGELIRRFKADGNAVLFGLRTFMEGVDIPTKALRLVILDKLPFAVPSDLLYQARCDAINQQYRDRWASFTKLTIPSMILVLTQAFGRLIRHIDDQGVVAILDSRLHTRRYGGTILSKLPPAPKITSIEEAGAFLETIQ
jgi:ATP-dependent DNA helicase DinG